MMYKHDCKIENDYIFTLISRSINYKELCIFNQFEKSFQADFYYWIYM